LGCLKRYSSTAFYSEPFPLPIAILYFRISATKILVLFFNNYPLSNFPHGGKVLTPSPVGEGGEGGFILKKTKF
jgi:hypothetical protein